MCTNDDFEKTLLSLGAGARPMGGISSITASWKVGGLLVGDGRGNVRLLDPRTTPKESLKVRLHCGKVASLDVHSHSGLLLLSGGTTDHAVRFVVVASIVAISTSAQVLYPLIIR